MTDKKNQDVTVEGKNVKVRNEGQTKSSISADSTGNTTSEDERRSGQDRRVNDGLEYIAKGGVERRNEEQRKKQVVRIQNGIKNLLKGDNKTFMDPEVMRALPPTIVKMMVQGKKETVDAITNRLGKGAVSENDDIRAQVSIVLATLTIKLITDRRIDDMIRLLPKLTEWIKFETIVSSAYKHICKQLQGLARSLLLNRHFAKANQIMEPFYIIYSGRIKKTEEINKISADVLKNIGTQDVLRLLKDELQADNKNMQDAAKAALDMIEGNIDGGGIETLVRKEGTASSAEEEKTGAEKPDQGEDELAQQLKIVDQHIEANGVESAVKLIFDMIVKYAKQRDFEKADTLRNKLMEVNPMALTEIVKSGEIIEEEKGGAIDKDRLNTWHELYDKLTDAETNALFFAMKTVEYDVKQTIFQQGESNSKLYFIYKGEVRLVTHQDGKEVVIKKLGAGDIMGEDTFFSSTVCTTTAVAVTKVEIDCLEKSVLAKWEEEIPGIESKISDYCLKIEKVSDLLKKKGRTRRSFERINITGKISMQPVDSTGSPIGDPIQGTLADISVGGLSFYLKIPKNKADKMMMEPKVNVKFIINTGASQHKMDQNGTIVGVLSHFYDFSVHIKFDKQLDEKLIVEIKKSSTSKDDELEILTDP